MCRDIANGGRRCPSHTNPVLIASRNAKRREAYAKNKGLILPGQKNNLGLVKYENSVHNTFTQNQTVTGVIDYEKLNSESYKEFGFQEINEPRSMFTLEQIQENSSRDIDSLPLEEKAALRYYTSTDYEWVNTALYGDGTYHRKGEPSDVREHQKYFVDEKLDLVEHRHIVYGPDKTADFLKEVTSHLDNGLRKYSGNQRIVYRGIGELNGALADFKKKPNPFTAYIDEKLPLGQEVVFDGYMSTSIQASVALNYTVRRQGIIFEILTASATNVTQISEYKEEREALVSRNTRFVVVGVHKGTTYGVGPGKHNSYENMNIVQLVEIDDTGSVAVNANTNLPELTDKQLYPPDVQKRAWDA